MISLKIKKKKNVWFFLVPIYLYLELLQKIYLR